MGVGWYRADDATYGAYAPRASAHVRDGIPVAVEICDHGVRRVVRVSRDGQSVSDWQTLPGVCEDPSRAARGIVYALALIGWCVLFGLVLGEIVRLMY